MTLTVKLILIENSYYVSINNYVLDSFQTMFSVTVAVYSQV